MAKYYYSEAHSISLRCYITKYQTVIWEWNCENYLSLKLQKIAGMVHLKHTTGSKICRSADKVIPTSYSQERVRSFQCVSLRTKNSDFRGGLSHHYELHRRVQCVHFRLWTYWQRKNLYDGGGEIQMKRVLKTEKDVHW